MTDQDLRRLAEAATPGEWAPAIPSGAGMAYVQAVRHGELRGEVAACLYDADARHISAASPATVLALLDRVEAAERAKERLQAEIAALLPGAKP